jgi:hypothetical protein
VIGRHAGSGISSTSVFWPNCKELIKWIGIGRARVPKIRSSFLKSLGENVVPFFPLPLTFQLRILMVCMFFCVTRVPRQSDMRN